MSSRVEFTDTQRAKIFVRDRATCCFSGANLWLLDAPLRPGFERDWVDHVKPAARGGKAEESNGVCASHTFNAKKRHNTADHAYLFEHGLPTWRYFSLFGVLPPEQVERLSRLARLVEADWYFNRAVGLVLISFDQRCRLERYDERPQRDDQYWVRAAYRKLVEFRQFPGGPTMAERGLVAAPTETQQAWLALCQATSQPRFAAALKPLFATYRANFLPWAKYFFEAETERQRLAALRFAERRPNLTHDTLQCICADYQLRHRSPEGRLTASGRPTLP